MTDKTNKPPVAPDAEAANPTAPPSSPPPGNGAANGYQVKIPVFEGPLDLLLHLVKKNEIDIYNIPISLITDQYFHYLDLMKSLNLEIAGDFLVMAATLAHIKSRLLLPVEPQPGAEGQEGPDPRDELVQRLLEYQRYKEAAEHLAGRNLLQRDVFVRPPEAVASEPAEIRYEDLNIFHLIEAFDRVLAKLPKQAAHQIVAEQVSVREKIIFLLDLFHGQEEIEFTAVFAQERTRLSAVALFLAILECVRLGLLTTSQEDLFAEIRVQRTDNFMNEDIREDAKRAIEGNR